ncbi:hypothetical protein IW256_003270 [Actinomadura viridis]|uniref:Uncharacterized protein n=1 Tax=Actinomadura viridis TaxID=58110 RepID=A0A931DJ84_9ACTN|nr:hypothetical protein [Actinomadura viridis]
MKDSGDERVSLGFRSGDSTGRPTRERSIIGGNRHGER